MRLSTFKQNIKNAQRRAKQLADKYEGMTEEQIDMLNKHYLKVLLAAIHIINNYGNIVVKNEILERKELSILAKITNSCYSYFSNKVSKFAFENSISKEQSNDFFVNEFRFSSSLFAISTTVRMGEPEEMNDLLEKMKDIIREHNENPALVS